MIFSFAKILALLIKHGYFIIFPISIVEGPIISVISGFLASQGYINVYLVSLLLIAGDIVGDTIYYMIGRYGGLPVIKKWGKYFKVDETKILQLEKVFENHGPKLLIFGKSQSFGSAILFAAGASKMPFGKYILYNFIPTVVKTAILVTIGYYFGQAYEKINDYMTKIGLISLLIIVVGAILYFLYRKRQL